MLRYGGEKGKGLWLFVEQEDIILFGICWMMIILRSENGVVFLFEISDGFWFRLYRGKSVFIFINVMYQEVYII